MIEPVSMPPARRVSRVFEPVVMEINSLRRWCISVAVVNPIGTNLEAEHSLLDYGSYIGINDQCLPSAISLSALASDIPLITSKALFGVYATASTVLYPASTTALISRALIPLPYIRSSVSCPSYPVISPAIDRESSEPQEQRGE